MRFENEQKVQNLQRFRGAEWWTKKLPRASLQWMMAPEIWASRNINLVSQSKFWCAEGIYLSLARLMFLTSTQLVFNLHDKNAQCMCVWVHIGIIYCTISHNICMNGLKINHWSYIDCIPCCLMSTKWTKLLSQHPNP